MSTTTLTTEFSSTSVTTRSTEPNTTHFTTITTKTGGVASITTNSTMSTTTLTSTLTTTLPTKQFFGDKRLEDRAVRAAGSRRNAKLPGHVYAREILLHHAVRDNLPVPAGTSVGLEKDCPTFALFQRHIHHIQAFAEDLLAQRIHQK